MGNWISLCVCVCVRARAQSRNDEILLVVPTNVMIDAPFFRLTSVNPPAPVTDISVLHD